MISAADFLASAGYDPSALRVALPGVEARRVPVRVAPGWFRAFWARGIRAVAMPWAIYLHPETFDRCRRSPDKHTGALIAHELAHIAQWRRGRTRHTFRYLSDYLRGRGRGLGHWESYKAIGAEEEARAVARRFVEEHAR